MIDIESAQARIALAEMEERRLREKAVTRAANWRLGLTLAWSLVILGGAIYLPQFHLQISTTDLGVLFLIYLFSSAWNEYRTREQLRGLRAELDELREQMRKFEDRT